MARTLRFMQMLNRKRHEYNNTIVQKRHKRKVCPQTLVSVMKTRHHCAVGEGVLQKAQCLFLGFMGGTHLKPVVKVYDVTINDLSDQPCEKAEMKEQIFSPYSGVRIQTLPLGTSEQQQCSLSALAESHNYLSKYLATASINTHLCD